MKGKMAGLALIAAMSAAPGAQSGHSDSDDVIAAQKRFYIAYQSCNAKEMAGLVTEDMMYLHSTGGLQRDKADFLKSMPAPEKCAFDILRVDVEKVRIYGGDTAVLFGRLHFKPKTGPEVAASLTASQVFVKQNGRWLFASNISMEPVPLDTSVRLAAQKK